MKQTSSLPNEGIDDSNVVYHAKTEGYPTMMLYMNELSKIFASSFGLMPKIRTCWLRLTMEENL
jgi:hypothetical protein